MLGGKPIIENNNITGDTHKINNNIYIDDYITHFPTVKQNITQPVYQQNGSIRVASPHIKHINNKGESLITASNVPEVFKTLGVQTKYSKDLAASPEVFKTSRVPSLTMHDSINKYIVSANRNELLEGIKPNINFSNISGNEYKSFIANIHDNKKLYVRFENNKFIFSDDSDGNIGEIRIDHLIKYIGSIYDIDNKFLSNISEYDNAKILINKFIGKVTYNDLTKISSVTIYDHLESPFMGDIDMIMYLNNMLSEFEKSRLAHELTFVNTQIRNKIEQIIKQFIYTMLNYTLSIIFIASDSIKNDKNKDDIKQKLLKDSNSIIHKINQFVQSQLGIVMKKSSEIEKMQLLSIKIQNMIMLKYNNLINELKNQNNMLQIRSINQNGGEQSVSGNKSSSDESSDSEYSNEQLQNIDDILSSTDVSGIYDVNV